MSPDRKGTKISPCALMLLTPALSSFGEEREKAVAAFRFMAGEQFKKELGTTEQLQICATRKSAWAGILGSTGKFSVIGVIYETW